MPRLGLPTLAPRGEADLEDFLPLDILAGALSSAFFSATSGESLTTVVACFAFVFPPNGVGFPPGVAAFARFRNFIRPLIFKTSCAWRTVLAALPKAPRSIIT